MCTICDNYFSTRKFKQASLLYSTLKISCILKNKTVFEKIHFNRQTRISKFEDESLTATDFVPELNNKLGFCFRDLVIYKVPLLG